VYQVTKLPIVGVMGSGEEAYPALSVPLGRTIAEHGCHLLTGAGGGVMREVAEAFTAVTGRKGLSIGIVRATRTPNDFVEIAIKTHLPDSGDRGKLPTSRNHINVLTADLVVVLPGSAGTQSEVELALEYRRRVVFFLRATPNGPEQQIGGLTAAELAKSVLGGAAVIANSIDDVERQIAQL
jgi:uncharacterized protein (TIGR00725 family)